MENSPTFLYRYSAVPVYCNKDLMAFLKINAEGGKGCKQDIENKMLGPTHIVQNTSAAAGHIGNKYKHISQVGGKQKHGEEGKSQSS